ncbi:MAG: hypothetical protein EON55_12630, partial [Alphaproteobacteria bacterium]
MVAATTNTTWWIADFRYLTPAETGTRLRRLQSELATQPHADIILDDLNGLDDPAVQYPLARLLGSLRRRDATALITTHRPPRKTTLHAILPNTVEPVDVPYLNEAEVADLVLQAGGDGKYASFVYSATAGGHPQLVMAALLHLKSSNWSRRSLASVLGGQPQSELGEERRAVRRRLVGTLPEESQMLLMRTSLVRGGFDRGLAIRIANLLPPIARGGLILDQLVGPWIEPYRRGRMRISPLLEDAAEEVLSEAELNAIHQCVAESLMATDIDALDASAAMHHALRSGRTKLVIAFAQSIITCDTDTAGYLAPFLVELMFLSTDEPIFRKNARAAAMMRLAQLTVLLPFGSAERVRACLSALDQERRGLEAATAFEVGALSKLLLQPRTGELLEEWFEILLRFDRLSCEEGPLAEANRALTGRTDQDLHTTGILFANQVSNITSVARFLSIMQRMDRENQETRDRILSAFLTGRGDVSVFVNHGWLKESRTEGFDWESAGRSYAAAVLLAIRWGNPVLASRCAIAQAM